MRFGPWWLSDYVLKIIAGYAVGLGWLWWQAPRHNIRRNQLTSFLWSIVLGALSVGRLGYGVYHSDYFAQHPVAILRFRMTGGIQGDFALAGGLLALLLWCRRVQQPPAKLVSLVTPAALCVIAGAWWGCAGLGCAWGREVLSVPPWARWAITAGPDLYHTVLPRYAVQAIGAGLALALAIISAPVSGTSGGWALVIYFCGAAALSFWRADPVPFLWGQRMDLVWSLCLGAIVAALLLSGQRKMRT